tara:strand:- start:35 stop:901 length:867 start_codon:yes stop_codon:yes gene_type:complete
MARNIAKKVEEKRVNFIINEVNQNTPLGISIKDSFELKFGKKIEKFENIGGKLKDHYDLIIVCEDGTRLKCEEKGTNCFYESLEDFTQPWANSVQRFNGPGNKFKIGIKYAKLWYSLVVSNKEISKEYGVNSEIPSEEEWLTKDAFQCGNPKTEWGKEFKRKYRAKHPKSSMNGKINSPKDYREIVNEDFKLTEEDKVILLKETQEILDHIMNEKECWLQTCGTIENKLNFRWHDKIEPPKITDIELEWKKGADIYFNFITENNLADFKCILRFGKGTGFSNIRFDIR